MSVVTIRQAEHAELDRLPPLYEWLFDPPGTRPTDWDPRRAVAALGRAASSDRAAVLVAASEDELVGLCTAYEEFESVRFGRRVCVEDLMVHPEHRSRGIGKQLLEEARRWAKSIGATELELNSSETRTGAHRFYDRENPSWRSLNFGWEL